ncbi:MAG: type II toxin-antitoxin system RelE/ParE family toxin [Paludibacteraceae bacterium]|nr:type II toxin-antitoxin system RelE/ParE family toxin [Paludibacteraceae bacterium]
MSKKREIKYKGEFDDDFMKIYKYISEDSSQNATKFAQEVKEKINWIIENPTAGQIEIQIHSKHNWYRYKIVMKSWKIIYKVTRTLLVFIGIIHTKQHPNETKKLRTNNYE